MKLDLNLIEKPRKNYKAALYWILFLVFVFTACGYAVHHNHLLAKELSSKLSTYKKQLDTAKIELDMLQRKSHTDPIPPLERSELKQRVSFINQLRNQRRFYWTEFLDHIEQEVPADIMLTNITPNSGSKQVMIRGLAKTTQDIVNFLEELQNSPHFNEVFLNKQEKFKYPVGETGVYKLVEKFTLSFYYGESGT